jgi:hypothetical protein
MKKKIPTYPIWICHPCGMRHGNKKCGVATWHENTCDICGAEASVTEPRDYGHLKDTWIKAAESRSGGQQNCKHCGSTEDFWWSRAEPMGYYCSNCGEGDESTTYPYVEAQGNIIAELSSRNDWVNKELAVVTEQRDEALSDLEFRRDLYRLQTKTLDDVCEQRDRLAEAITSIVSGAVYEARCIEIAREALQSLTTNEQ